MRPWPAFSAARLLDQGRALHRCWKADEILTTSGATAAVLLIVQYLKVPPDRVWKISTRVFVLALSFVVMLAVKYFTGGSC